jgi:hypothetical protein
MGYKLHLSLLMNLPYLKNKIENFDPGNISYNLISPGCPGFANSMEHMLCGPVVSKKSRACNITL